MRMGFFYVPNGMFLSNFHPAGNGGAGFELTPILKPLEPFRDQMTVVTGLSNLGVISPNEGGGVHTRAHGGWLNGVLPKRTEGADITAGKTIDQYAADKLGADTQLRSLELTTESNFMVGNCENGYSCAYLNSTSWRTPNRRRSRTSAIRASSSSACSATAAACTARLAEMQTGPQHPGLGGRQHAAAASSGSASAIAGAVNEYLDSVREVERRIQRAEQNNATTPLPSLEQPAGVPDGYEEHVRLLMDLLVLAYQADITRVSCMQLARESSGRTYPDIGVPEGHHTVSHHQLITGYCGSRCGASR